MANLCAPLQVYIVISIISIITFIINMFTNVHVTQVNNPSDLYLKVQASKHGYIALFIKIVFIILFGYLLQVMCDNKLDKYVWIVMFFPFIIFLFVTLYSMSIGAISAIRGNTGLLAGSSGFSVGGPDDDVDDFDDDDVGGDDEFDGVDDFGDDDAGNFEFDGGDVDGDLDDTGDDLDLDDPDLDDVGDDLDLDDLDLDDPDDDGDDDVGDVDGDAAAAAAVDFVDDGGNNFCVGAGPAPWYKEAPFGGPGV